MRRRMLGWAAWMALAAVGCGSSDGGTEPEGDLPRADGGPAEPIGDGGDAGFDTGDAKGDGDVAPDTASDGQDDAQDGGDAACVSPWESWNGGLAGGPVERAAFDPRTPGVAWAFSGARVWKSADHGATWSLRTEAAPHLHALALPPGAADVLLAASDDGVQRSDDGGATWARLSLGSFPIDTIAVDPADARRVLVAGGATVLRSVDGGATWEAGGYGLPYGAIQRFASDASEPDTVVAAVVLEDANGWTFDGAIVRTTDAGKTWTTVMDDIHRALDVAGCAAHPETMYAATASGLARSVDRGASWSMVAYAGRMIRNVAVTGADCETVYATLDADGVVRSTDGADTFSAPLTSGIELQPGYAYADALSVDPADAKTLLAATHGAAYRTTSGGDAWTVASGVGTLGPRWLATEPGRTWMATWGAGLWSRAAGADWQRTPSSVMPRDWISRLWVDPATSGRMFVGIGAGGGDLFRTTDDGTSFEAAGLDGTNPFAFAVDPVDAQIVYAGTQTGGVHRSTDGGAHWSKRSTNLDAFVMSLAIDPADGQHLLAGTDAKGVYVSHDAGATWTASSTSLAGGEVGTLLRAGTTFWAAVRDVGVFRSDDGDAWTKVDQGLASLHVTGLVADGGTLYATAGGRVYACADGATWTELDPECGPAEGAQQLVVHGEGASKWLVTGAATGVQRRKL